jgi:hypothetical protein
MTTSKELDVLYQKVDDLMREGKLEELDRMFVFSPQADLDYMVGLLTASLPVKSKLPSRPAYFEKVVEHCYRGGERHPLLLQGLG